MRIRRKKGEEKGEQLPLEEDKDTKGKKSAGKKKMVRDEGPKWISLAVLVATIVAAGWFWVMGSGGLSGVGKVVGGFLSGWGGSREYVIE